MYIYVLQIPLTILESINNYKVLFNIVLSTENEDNSANKSLQRYQLSL